MSVYADALSKELRSKCSVFAGKSVLVELPEGFKHLESLVEEILSSCGASSISFRLEPTYGACETVACETPGVDIVLHIGHDPYPLRLLRSCGSTKILYIPLALKPDIVDIENLADKVVSLLNGASRVTIGYTSQYRLIAASLAGHFRKRGLRVDALGLILGCYFSGLDKKRVDAHIVLGGRFHALGLGLAVHGEERVIMVTPEELRVEDVSDEVLRELSRRYWIANNAREAKSWGVIQGGRASQCRPILASVVTGALRALGRRYRVYTVRRFVSKDLDAIQDIDAFVVLACPRLAIEDAARHYRPVLTPGELFYALGLSEKIRFPW